ncbi:MAG: cellulose synthase/poly-beta-1,6-N-acetylglucosamine synthase-like glycosyltransferase [Hyphomicrobiaceae bacterium]|jgi:cellulose synthase/poly-beta-1,6-N-acetylglucosamine synthase-like glycosyltransferase
MVGARARDCVAVVPAWRAGATIGRTLASLAAAGVDRVVVVASGGGETAAHARAFGVCHGNLDVQIVESSRRLSAGAARNRGRLIAGPCEFLLFVDADVRVARDCVDLLLAHATKECLAAVAASILCEGRRPISLARHLLEFKEAEGRTTIPPTWRLPSTCLLVRSEAFDDVGGFLDAWPGEDLCFDQALIDRGYRRRLVPEATAFHLHPVGVAEMLRHQVRLGSTAAQARRASSLPGSFLVERAYLSPLLLPVRMLRILAWSFRCGVGTFATTLALFPLWSAGLTAWTVAFVREAAARGTLHESRVAAGSPETGAGRTDARSPTTPTLGVHEALAMSRR